jgi:hypothetical protein
VGPGHAAHQRGSPANRSIWATPAARRAGQDLTAARAPALPPVPAGPSCPSRTTGTCPSRYRRHARHLNERQPRPPHRCPAHPGQAPATGPADAGQHPDHPLPPPHASQQQRVTTPETPQTHSTRRTPSMRSSSRRATTWQMRSERPVLLRPARLVGPLLNGRAEACAQLVADPAPCLIRKLWSLEGPLASRAPDRPTRGGHWRGR